MKRRDFLKYSTPAVAAPILLNNMPVKAITNAPWMQALMAGPALADDRVLVIVQLGGGNDGLNTIIPLDQYQYLSLSGSAGGRQSILINEARTTKLMRNGVNTIPQTALNPGATGLADLFADEKLCLLPGVGYQNPDFSHFRATDIWLTGSDSSQYWTTGWAGRELDEHYPHYYSNPYKGPLAVTIGSSSSLAFLTNNGDMGLAVQNPSAGKQYFIGNTDTAPNTLYGRELEYVRGVVQSANTFSNAIKNAYDSGTNVGAYPQSDLANQLKMVARLMNGGLGSKIFHVNIGGFDTHVNQVNGGDNAAGAHTNLWQTIGDAIKAFQNDIRQMIDDNGNTYEDRVAGFTFSEFGRTIKSNTTMGTDHGTTGPVFVFGKYVNSKLIGGNPQVFDTNANAIKPDLDVQFDYRSVYASILYQWFKVSKTVIDTAFGKNFNSGSPGQNIYDGGFHCNLPIFRSNAGLKEGNAGDGKEALNVFVQRHVVITPTRIQYETLSDNEKVEIAIYSMSGQLLKTLIDTGMGKGKHILEVNTSDFSSGVYIYHVQTGADVNTKKIVIQ